MISPRPPRASIDVTDVIDSQRFGTFHFAIAAWMFITLLVDGYDSAVVGFAAPFLTYAWDIRDPSKLGSLFSASVLGILLGGPLFGYIGDRFGRKPGLVLGAVVVGVATLAAAGSSNLAELIPLRVVAGIGIGGVMPLAFVTSAEFAPKHIRATLIAAGGTGVALGGGLAGVTSSLLASTWGWEVLFLIGGGLPIVIAFLITIFVPESPKYLVLHPGRELELSRVLRRIRPDLKVGPDTVFFMSDEKRTRAASVKELFRGPLAYVTPTLWIVFISVGMALYFIQSWTPTILTHSGLSPRFATIATSSFQFGAVFSPLLVGPLVDRFGIRPIAIFLVLAVPLIAVAGVSTASAPLMLATLFGIGFTLIGAQIGLIATAGMLYPSGIRAEGIGSASGLQKLGSITGALVGGYLLGVPVHWVFAIVAIPVAIAALICGMLARISRSDSVG